MATAAGVVARGAGNAGQATARRGWPESLREETVSFLKGDNNSPWAILAETVIGCVPVVGQLIDARDIIRGLIEVSAAPASPLAWFNLITALIGLVPGGGDAVKRSLRAVKSRTVRIDELLDMIRRFYRGDPEQLLRQALDLGRLRRILDDILTNPNLTRHLDGPTLGDAGDESERADGGGAADPNSGGGRAGARGSARRAPVRQNNGRVTQMSYGWIDLRLARAIGATSPDLTRIRRETAGRRSYSRHVLFFSIPQAVSHAEALILHGSGRQVEHSFHAAHQVTREWRDNEISQVVNDRAGAEASSRRAR